jgi:hypothetical protein
MSSPSAPTGATDHEPSVQDLVVPVQVDQAGIQEPAAVTHNVDPEDDQRGDEDVFDESHYSGAATGNSLTRELVQTHKTVFTIMESSSVLIFNLLTVSIPYFLLHPDFFDGHETQCSLLERVSHPVTQALILVYQLRSYADFGQSPTAPSASVSLTSNVPLWSSASTYPDA